MSPRFGAFSRMFPRDSAAEVAGALREAGFDLTHLSMPARRLSSLPSDTDFDDANSAFRAQRVSVFTLSGTFNAINRDHERLKRDIAAAQAVIAHAPRLGAKAVTVCTGSESENMWAWHPDNLSTDAWTRMRATLDELIPTASEHGVVLGIEPEAANVVSNAERAAALLTQLGGDARHVRIVLDPANLLSADTMSNQRAVLEDAFDRLGSHTMVLHAKDVAPVGEHVAVGHGLLDYPLIATLHATHTPDVPVILQDVPEDDVKRALAFVSELEWRE